LISIKPNAESSRWHGIKGPISPARTFALDQSDSAPVDFDERDPGMLEMFKLAVLGAKRNGRHIGICGEAPANYPEIARFLAQIGIDAISVNPSSILRTMQAICDAEAGSRSADVPEAVK
jgi:phosphoenolpyruvate synthase/pyruvate phosphate dikinase